jgi:hypothetical protein
MSTVAIVDVAFAAATALTIPSHQAGDLLCAFAYRGTNNSAVTVPSGWSPAGFSNGNAQRSQLAWIQATGASHTSGTWTNAEMLMVAVLRCDGHVIVPRLTTANSSASTTSVVYAALTGTSEMSDTNYVLSLVGVNSSSGNAQTLAPSGSTNAGSGASDGNAIGIHRTNAAVSSFSGGTVTASVAAKRHTWVFEAALVPVGVSRRLRSRFAHGGFRA